MKYDVMIIGGGPGGYSAAHKAAQNGLKTVLFEKKEVGGTCLNRGCIPMKALIEAARSYRSAKNADLFGVHSQEVSFDYEKVNARRDDVVLKLRSGIEKMLKGDKVEVVKGEAKIIGKDRVSCNGETYEGDNIVIAAGSISARPPIEGIENAISSDEILEEAFALPSSLIIIGGGVIGSEIADALSCFGVKVSVVEMADRLIPTMDRDLGQRLGMFFKKAGIDVILSASVKKIAKEEDGKSVTYADKNGNEVCLKADEVLVATGRRANIAGLLDENIGLETYRGVKSDENGKTNIDHIYVIGDARDGNIQLAHVAECQGENVIDLILGKEPEIDMSVIPSGIYTEPEIAAVGVREDELKEKGIAYSAKKALTGANGRCLIENSESGFVKLLIADDRIVGASIVAPHATELISELAVVVERGLSPRQLAGVVHPHPTISEMIRDALK